MRRLIVTVTCSMLGAPACGPELAVTSSIASSDESSGGDGSSTPEEDRETLLIISAIIVVSTIVGIVSAVSGDGMWAYMQEHRQDIRRALASGDGPFTSDLTAALQLPASELPRVARILREGRPWLAPCLDGDLPDTRAEPTATREFWGRLLTMLAADPVTGPRVELLERRAHEMMAAGT